ncbi:MAG: NAD(P)-dependent oxidoreductase [Terriglobales bacterium]|jgi:putative NADH-flavin reductase
MKLLIFGATGGTGRQLVDQALAQGHEVTAFVRNPAKMPTEHEKLKVVKGNVKDCHSVGAAVASQDAVFSALGVRFNWLPLILAVVVSQVLVRTIAMPRWLHLLTDIGLPVLALLYTARTPPVVSEATKCILAAMEREGTKLFICESSLGVGDSKGQLGAFYNYFFIPVLLRHVFADKEVQEKVIQSSHVEWVIVRPGALTNGPRTGKYRAGFPVNDKSIAGSISRADTAEFMLRQLTDSTYLRKTPGLSY